ncbi:unnamed protein product [Leptidea sinapis]|uniref:Mitochondrial-processing peptidase subunit beta n=1 Tax=Leptidea sinapis TaxID=189913 RepID=A0A5E4PMC8_9NEOP|nr:unnamed protein product [Leptidea sinapis]
METNSPLSCVNLIIEVGSRFEKPHINGITHLIEHMAFRGFIDMNEFELEEKLFNLNATITATTSREFQIFSGICLNEMAGEMVKMLSKIITQLNLSDEMMQLGKMNICTQHVDTDFDPKVVVFDYLKETAFQGTQLGQRVIGPSANIQKLDQACVNHFMYKNYNSSRIVLASSGGTDPQNIVSSAQDHLKCLPLVSEAPDYGPQRYTGSQVIYRDDSMPFAHVAIAFEVPGYNSPEHLNLLVASNIIGSWHKSQGGTDRHAPPLALKSSTSQLCESFESFYIPYRDVGLWGIYFLSARMSVEDMVYNVYNEWMKLCNIITVNEIARGVNATRLQLAKRADSIVSSSRDIGIQLLLTTKICTLQDYEKRFEILSPDCIKETMYTYIYDKCPVVAAVGPTEGLPHYTRLTAYGNWLRW